MKKDNLEQFIENNIESFDNLNPPALAWMNIEKGLPVSKKGGIAKLWPYVWKAAAAVLIFASAWLLNDYMDYKQSFPGTEPASSIATNPALNELMDAEAYYTSQISNKQVELATYAKLHPEIIEDLKKEFKEMDKEKDQLKKDLAESNADEKVIEAIILSYRVKIEILDQMLTELRGTKDKNTRQMPTETKL
jgi:hypothetical protein